MVSLFRVDRRHQGRLCQHLTRNLPFLPCWSQQTCRRGGRAFGRFIFFATTSFSPECDWVGWQFWQGICSLSPCSLVRLSRQPSVRFQSSTFLIKPVYLVLSPISYVCDGLLQKNVWSWDPLPRGLSTEESRSSLQRNSQLKFVFTRCPSNSVRRGELY